MLRRLLGRVFLSLQIKVTGVRVSRAPLTEQRGFEFKDNGYKGLNILMLLRRLLKEMKERVDAEFEEEEVMIELVHILLEVGR